MKRNIKYLQIYRYNGNIEDGPDSTLETRFRCQRVGLGMHVLHTQASIYPLYLVTLLMRQPVIDPVFHTLLILFWDWRLGSWPPQATPMHNTSAYLVSVGLLHISIYNGV